ncbi:MULTISPECIES: hypothetical protein [Gordonia]|uniref:5'-methylthioadenosine/S-adenosylhomocysteine nucleosidase family protein n=1 Tax=Gordonia TaxID=2053 RepID=UPI003394968D
MKEVDQTGAYTFADCTDRVELPFVLVQSAARANLHAASSVEKWIRLFRPQHILVVGTAGGIHRPTSNDRPYTKWKGPSLGDVVVSEYVHYAEFKKVSSGGNLMRYMPIEQPSVFLLENARAVIQDGKWSELSRDFWQQKGSSCPNASIEEVLSGEVVQDNPTDPMQQFLMRYFDRAGAVEMESAGVGQRLHATRNTVHYAPGFLAVRGISDLVYARGPKRDLKRKDLPRAHADKTEERDDWSPAAAASATALAVALTARLVKEDQPAHSGHGSISGYDLWSGSSLSDLEGSLPA